ncbi:Protein CBG26666 [Caenorhabditis briggsae]|uniref:Protein CBG26666 n=1 Tax=Caenorhabditis briggsae TaxID=6238 RepID=B6IE29_CAEBR|nr:Protein CBG26666 [Caenorhabditis briggsae]CAS01093.1 Protein CBG26666 [Caenorhabditis briggsae]
MKLLFLLLCFIISSLAIDSVPSDLHIVKSKTFEFSDFRELLEWDFDLRDIASYVHQSPSAITFLSTASSTIPISFSKCGMDGLMFELTREVPLVVDDFLLSHFELMAFLYCTQNDYQFVLDLTAITPANHTSGSILIELEAMNNHLDTLTLRIFSVLFIALIIALTVFLAIIIHKRLQERRQEKRALSTLDAANDIEMVTLTDGPADEQDWI